MLRPCNELLRVQFDDELFLRGQRNRVALRLLEDATAERLAVANFRDHVQPGADLRFYENVLAFINAREKRSGANLCVWQRQRIVLGTSAQ